MTYHKYLMGALIGLLCMLQYKLIFGASAIGNVMTLSHEVKQQTHTLRELDERNQMLLAEVQDLKSKQEALEERARTDLGMIKQGEVFIHDVQ